MLGSNLCMLEAFNIVISIYISSLFRQQKYCCSVEVNMFLSLCTDCVLLLGVGKQH